ncbi:unnamed protein product [Cladocopium goreaui]|uniref:Uncharacterized protein n=2 Tax=Cladocopium goreaui TaxID=2562237 RepID=A0A9P1G0Y8_9DINO|nr:unnamed protein product [Cladocopium goreaui]
MGCTSSSHKPQEMSRTTRTVVRWTVEYDEVAIDVAEPRWSFRSMEHMEQIPPQSTHSGAELERFMKEVDSADLERVVQQKREDHLARRLHMRGFD